MEIHGTFQIRSPKIEELLIYLFFKVDDFLLAFHLVVVLFILLNAILMNEPSAQLNWQLAVFTDQEAKLPTGNYKDTEPVNGLA